MNIKTTLLAALLVLTPVAVRAQDADNYESYRVSCNSGAECNDFDVNYQEDEVAQRTRNRRTRRTRAADTKYYVGGNIAPFFPFDGDLDIGFGGGIFGGYKFTDNISAEVEIFDYFGGTETDDLGYNNFGATANGVYRYYIDQRNPQSLYVFGGLGVGIGVASATGDVADDLDDAGVDTSETGFLVQGKGGVGYPVTDKIDAFAQTKFFNIFIDGEDADGLAIDVGATYKF
jgi:hypothetical protein